MPAICLIVPCYNEEDRFNQEAFSSFLAKNPNYHILFINDGSSDGTAQMLSSFTDGIGQAELLDLAQNGGKAEAVRQGVLQAEKNKMYDLIGFIDADLATPLEEILSFENVFENNDHFLVALGSRWKRLGAQIDRNVVRHYLGRIFATITSILFSFSIYDTQCGAKLMRNKDLDKIFSQPFLSPWFFDIEIICRYQNLYPEREIDDWAIEIPLNKWREIGGSRIKIWDFIKAPLALLRIRTHYRKKDVQKER